jgi:hypothetical protein
MEARVGKRVRTVETRRTAMLSNRQCQGVRGLLWLWLSCSLACGGGRSPLLSSALPEATGPGIPETSDGGLLPSTPGVVRCGSTVCAHGYRCCLSAEGRPAPIGCDSRSKSGCLGMDYDHSRSCDETADCDPGELCCVGVELFPAPTLGSYCSYSLTASPVTSCEDNNFVACGSDDDCRAVSAQPCVAQRCRGDVVQTCGRLPSEWCPP